jgi:hypothetical protein
LKSCTGRKTKWYFFMLAQTPMKIFFRFSNSRWFEWTFWSTLGLKIWRFKKYKNHDFIYHIGHVKTDKNCDFWTQPSPILILTTKTTTTTTKIYLGVTETEILKKNVFLIYFKLSKLVEDYHFLLLSSKLLNHCCCLENIDFWILCIEQQVTILFLWVFPSWKPSSKTQFIALILNHHF